MIGRTDYHNVAGTRCPTDLVEVPSILMEQFLASGPVLRRFARHYRDGRPLPEHILKTRNFGRPERSALESNTQIVMAMADQALHACTAQDHPIDSMRVWNGIIDRYGAFPSTPDTSWHGRFGHLVGYGASYYAYLFDRLLANHIWQRLFQSDPLDRDAGERYKTELLRWGGGKDSWECLGSLLQDNVIRGGGQAALESLTSLRTDALQL